MNGQKADPTTAGVALVTGGAHGIGAAIVESLQDEGWAVVAADLDTHNPECRPTLMSGLDVTDEEQRDNLVAEIVDRWGRLDVLVNNAGINRPTAAEDAADQLWRDLLEVNLVGAVGMSRAALPALRQTRGSIVNIGSTAGTLAIAGSAPYGVSKAAVMHFTRIAALEWAPYGIRVNAVAPTIVPTRMTEEVMRDEGYMSKKMATIPLGVYPEPRDVADAVAFLCSRAASRITGHTVYVDGGATLR